jgi:hypothetical protein
MGRRSRPYVPLEVDFFDNPKIIAAGEPATMLYLRGLALCKRQWQTDGLIYENQLSTFRLRGVHDRAAKLTELGLWVHEDDGYRVAGWLDRNKSAQELDIISQERANAGSRGGIASGQVRGEQAKQSASENEASWLDPSKQAKNGCEPNSIQSQINSSEEENNSSSESSQSLSFEADRKLQAILQRIADKKIFDSPTRPNHPDRYRNTVERDVEEIYGARARILLATDVEGRTSVAEFVTELLLETDDPGPHVRSIGASR